MRTVRKHLFQANLQIGVSCNIWWTWRYKSIRAKVFEHCFMKLLDNITRNEAWCKGANNSSTPTTVRFSDGLKTRHLQLHRNLCNLSAALSGKDKSGSTAVCPTIELKHIYFWNCGDSRAVLCRTGSTVFTTADHKPVNPIEKKRIQNAGSVFCIQTDIECRLCILYPNEYRMQAPLPAFCIRNEWIQNADRSLAPKFWIRSFSVRLTVCNRRLQRPWIQRMKGVLAVSRILEDWIQEGPW